LPPGARPKAQGAGDWIQIISFYKIMTDRSDFKYATDLGKYDPKGFLMTEGTSKHAWMARMAESLWSEGTIPASVYKISGQKKKEKRASFNILRGYHNLVDNIIQICIITSLFCRIIE